MSQMILALLTLLVLTTPAWGQPTPTWRNDSLGRPAPPCMVLDATTGLSSPCSASNPLPVGGGPGLGTTSGATITGFGKQWFPSTVTGSIAGGNQMRAFFLDDTNVAFLRRSTGCGNCLQVAISTDGGVTATFFSTSAIIGNSLSAAHRVPSTTPRYLVSSIGGPLNIFQSASLSSGWAAVVGLGASPIAAWGSNAAGTTVLSYDTAGTTCRSTDNGVTFGQCVATGEGAGGPVTFAGGTNWLLTSNSGNIRRSTNDGVSWSTPVATFANGVSIQCQSPTFQVCLMTDSGGNVHRSTNAGVTWPSITLSGGAAGLCHFGSGNVATGLGTPPIGFAAIAQNVFSSFNAGVAWFPGQTNGSHWDGTGVPSLGSLDCLNGRGIATYQTTGGGVNVFAVYNPLTSPGGTLQSSAGGYNVSALIQAGVILQTTPVTSAANTAAAVTLTNGGSSRICIRRIELFNTGAAGNFTLTVSDGGTVVLNAGTVVLGAPPQGSVIREGAPLLCSQTGNNLVVNIGAGGAGAISTTSVIADRYPN